MSIAGYEIVSNTQPVELLAANDYRGWLSVSAPSGKQVLGGGGFINQSGMTALVASRPDGSGNWTVAVDDLTPQENTVQVTVYAVCASVN